MAKKSIERNLGTGSITFLEADQTFDCNELDGFTELNSFNKEVFMNGLTQRLSDLNASFGPKAGYTVKNRADRRQEQWENFKAGKFGLRSASQKGVKSIRESLSRAIENELDHSLAKSVICPELPEEQFIQIWDSIIKENELKEDN